MTHSFSVEFAVKYGVFSSLIIGQIYFWCCKNEEKKKNLQDGKYWTLCTIEGFTKVFPYLTENQIKYCLQNLKSNDLLLTANFNKNTFDKTPWYTLSDKALSIIKNSSIDGRNFSHRQENIFPQSTIENNSINISIKERNIKERKAPTLEEIESFIKERKSPVDVQRFYDYYSVNNWKDKNGVDILSNWKQRVISWEKDEKRPKNEKVELTEKEKKFYGERNGLF